MNTDEKDLKGTHLGGEERAVPGQTDIGTVCQHIARYNLALFYASNKKVIDAACGVGYGSYLLGMVAESVASYDISSIAISYAKNKYASENISFDVCDVLNLNTKADLIVSFETLEHVSDLNKLEEVFINCLNPKGTLIFSVPLNEDKNFNPYHSHTFTVPEAKSIFPRLKADDELIQRGVNFYPLNSNFPHDLKYTFYVSIRVLAD